MKKDIFGRKALILLSLLPLLAQAITINVSDLGVKPGEDATLAINKVLLNADKTQPITLRFAPGEYLFKADHAIERYFTVSNNNNGMKRTAFPLFGFSSVEIDGQGASFIFSGKIVPFIVDKSSNVTLKNFSIDTKEPYLLEGTVIGVDSAAKTFDLRIADEFPYKVRKKELVFTTPVAEYGMGSNLFFDPATRTVVYNAPAYKMDTWNPWLNERYDAEEIGQGVVRITNTISKLPELGWVMAIKHRNSELCRVVPGILMQFSRNIRIENVTLYQAGAMGLIAQRCEDVCMERFDVVANEKRKRMVSTLADATHFVNCKGMIRFESCRFESMLDDATNVHGIYAKVTSIINPNTLGYQLVHGEQTGFPFAEKGDTLVLIKQETLSTYGKPFVVKATKVFNESYCEVEFEEEVASTYKEGSALENISWYPEVVMRNCSVSRNRARSVLFSVPRRVVVENNTFSSMMGAISIGGDANYWYESGASNEVIIRNNTIIDCATSSANTALIHICPDIKNPDIKKDYIHRNYLIEENTIRHFDRILLDAEWTEGIIVRNNKMTQTGTFPSYQPQASTFILKHCKDVTIENNKFDLKLPATIETDNCINIKTKGNKGMKNMKL